MNGDNETDRLFWDFENEEVQFNLTLWASWDKMHTVLFDPNDDTEYTFEELPKVTVRSGEKIPANPVAPPLRPGYLFAGWTVNGDNETDRLYWDFENEQVEFNLTLWASWDISDEGGSNSGGEPEDGTNSGGEPEDGGEPESGTNIGGEPESGTNSGGEPEDGTNSGGEPEEEANSIAEPEEDNTLVVDEDKLPKSGNGEREIGKGNSIIDEEQVPAASSSLDQVPLTGDTGFSWKFHASILLICFLGLATISFYRRKGYESGETVKE